MPRILMGLLLVGCTAQADVESGVVGTEKAVEPSELAGAHGWVPQTPAEAVHAQAVASSTVLLTDPERMLDILSAQQGERDHGCHDVALGSLLPLGAW